MALYFSTPRGRASPADSSTAAAAALVVPFSLDQGGPAPQENTASSDSDVGLCFSDSWRPSFTSRLIDCCSGGAGTSMVVQKHTPVERPWSLQGFPPHELLHGDVIELLELAPGAFLWYDLRTVHEFLVDLRRWYIHDATRRPPASRGKTIALPTYVHACGRKRARRCRAVASTLCRSDNLPS